MYGVCQIISGKTKEKNIPNNNYYMYLKSAFHFFPLRSHNVKHIQIQLCNEIYFFLNFYIAIKSMIDI